MNGLAPVKPVGTLNAGRSGGDSIGRVTAPSEKGCHS
jgi:hypothetical protein